MRLDEITRSNIVWTRLKGIDLASIDEYPIIIDLLKRLIYLGSHYRVVTYSKTILDFENILIEFINDDYGNYPNNRDMNKFKNKCKKMLTNIQYLKSKLP